MNVKLTRARAGDYPMDSSAFYDDVYLANPNKWDNVLRDIIAFALIAAFTNNPVRVLDIGCGNGHTINFLTRRWLYTTFYGVDLSQEAIRLARLKAPQAQFHVGNFEDIDIPYCDVVILMGVAEHFRDIVGSMKRVKEMGEVIYLEAPNCLAYSDNEEEGFRKTTEGTDQEEWHLRRKTWEERLSEAGLNIMQSVAGMTRGTEFIWVLR